MPLPELPPVPFVSVIVTAYNVEKFVASAIDSALKVDWPANRLEIIVINDGSTDSTLSILKRYGRRIRLIDQANKGCFAAMTVGMQAARGDLIAFLDGDDEWPRDKLRRQVRIFHEQPKVGLVFGDLEIIDSNGAILQPSYFSWGGLQPARGKILGRLLGDNFVVTGSIVVRADLRDVYCPIPDDAAAYDWYVAARVAEVAQLECVSKTVCRYRFHGANMTFGQDGATRFANYLKELRFTHRILTEFDMSTVSTAQMVFALGVANTKLMAAAGSLGVKPASLVQVSEDGKAASEESFRKADNFNNVSDGDAAMRAVVRALAQDPLNQAAVTLFEELNQQANNVTITNNPEHTLITRTSVVRADARELAADPALLTAWAQEFDSNDDVTLVAFVDPDSCDLVTAALAQIAESVGLENDNAPDVLLHPCAAPEQLPIKYLGAYSRGLLDFDLESYDVARLPELHGRVSPLGGIRGLRITA